MAPLPEPGALQAVVWPSANGDSLHIGPGSPRCLLKPFYQAQASEAPPLPDHLYAGFFQAVIDGAGVMARDDSNSEAESCPLLISDWVHQDAEW